MCLIYTCIMYITFVMRHICCLCSSLGQRSPTRARPGKGKAAQHRTRQNRAGSGKGRAGIGKGREAKGKLWQGRKGQGRAKHDKAGQGREEQHSAGQEWAGQGREWEDTA